MDNPAKLPLPLNIVPQTCRIAEVSSSQEAMREKIIHERAWNCFEGHRCSI
jgi:hypothetical protein